MIGAILPLAHSTLQEEEVKGRKKREEGEEESRVVKCLLGGKIGGKSSFTIYFQVVEPISSEQVFLQLELSFINQNNEFVTRVFTKKTERNWKRKSFL